MPNNAPCGGDAYKPWSDAPYPVDRDYWTCATCAHASPEAAERDINKSAGIDVRGTLPGPFGKCLGGAGLALRRERRR